MTQYASSTPFVCPEPFRTPLLPGPVEGPVSQIDCYRARPVDSGRTFEVTHYRGWIRPDTGAWNFKTDDAVMMSLDETVTHFKFAEQGAGLSATAQTDKSFDAAWQESIRTSSDPEQVLGAEFAPLANLPLMGDALANYNLMVLNNGELMLLGDDGLPVNTSNLDRSVLLRAQKAQRANSAKTLVSAAAQKNGVIRTGFWAQLKGILSPVPAPPTLPKPPELLRLDQPYSDVEALLKLIGNEPELMRAVLEDAEQYLPKQDNYGKSPSFEKNVWPINTGNTHLPSAIRRAFTLINFKVDHKAMAKQANTFLLIAQRCVKDSNWKFLNGMLENRGENNFYCAAILADYEHKVFGFITDSTKAQLLRPYQGSRDSERPDTAIVGDYLENTLVPPVWRETVALGQSWSGYNWKSLARGTARQIMNHPEKNIVMTCEGDDYKLFTDKRNYGGGFYDHYLQIPQSAFYPHAKAHRADLDRRIEPTASRLLKYSKRWWRPELVVAQLRPDLVRPDQQHLIPKPAQPVLPTPERPALSAPAKAAPGRSYGGGVTEF